jgi:hypothetical protein
MIDLHVGMQVFHNGVPVELLYCVEAMPDHGSSQAYEKWKIRPLFVAGEDREAVFSPHDTISFLHTGRSTARLSKVRGAGNRKYATA